MTRRQISGAMARPWELPDLYEVIGAARGKSDKLFGRFETLDSACSAACSLSRGLGVGGYVGVYDTEGIEIYVYQGTTI